jgi:hypothetical protein
MPNRRIFYAVHQIAFAPDGGTSFTAAHGVQSVGMTTTFNLQQVFELGQLAIYDNIEQIPDIELTLEKVLDGYPLLYHLGTNPSTTGTLIGRSNTRTGIAIDVFPDTLDCSSGVPIAEVFMSGMVVSSLTYTFPVDGNSTEAATFVGNNKLWKLTGFYYSGVFAGNDDAPIGSGGTQHRWNVVMVPPTGASTLDSNGQLVALCTILPTDIDGINSSGVNVIGSDGNFAAHIQGITVSCDLGRDQILELGRKAPYFRYVTFPVEVTTEITTVGVKWDGISATEVGGTNGAGPGNNLKYQSIRVYTQEGTFISLGQKNKLNSVAYGGGDAGGGGGNVTLTYRYITFNDFTVKHPADPSALGTTAV